MFLGTSWNMLVTKQDSSLTMGCDIIISRLLYQKNRQSEFQ